MTEEFFKLYRMVGDFMFKFLAYYIKSKDLFDWRCCFYSVSDLGKSESLSNDILYEYMISDKKSTRNKNKTLSSLSSKLCFLLGSE